MINTNAARKQARGVASEQAERMDYRYLAYIYKSKGSNAFLLKAECVLLEILLADGKQIY